MELSDSEKKIILESHIKNALTNVYNLQISLIAEQAKENPNSILVDSLSQQMVDENAKKDALLEELAKF